jgi:hypothetical protein
VDKSSANENKLGLCTLIALSEAKEFAKQECSGSRTHYNPVAGDNNQWPLFYVMAITKNAKRGIRERLGPEKSTSRPSRRAVQMG